MRVDETVDEHLDPEHASRGSLNGNGIAMHTPDGTGADSSVK